MDVFWARGYEDASLLALLQGMQITRGSLYKAFHDKKTLFLTILERYEAAAVLPAVDLLSNPAIPDGVARIEALFDKVIAQVRAGDRRGCLLCTAAAGPASEDADIAEAVGRILGRMQEGFAVALAASPTHASRPEEVRQALADTLMTYYTGLRILARSQADIAMLDRSAEAVLRLLRGMPDVGKKAAPTGV